MTKKKKTYRVNVDANNAQAAINVIQQQTREAVKSDFLDGLNPDGSAPRGLIATIARKYGYTQAGITRMLASQGIKKQTRYTNADTL